MNRVSLLLQGPVCVLTVTGLAAAEPPPPTRVLDWSGRTTFVAPVGASGRVARVRIESKPASTDVRCGDSSPDYDTAILRYQVASTPVLEVGAKVATPSPITGGFEFDLPLKSGYFTVFQFEKRQSEERRTQWSACRELLQARTDTPEYGAAAAGWAAAEKSGKQQASELDAALQGLQREAEQLGQNASDRAASRVIELQAASRAAATDRQLLATCLGGGATCSASGASGATAATIGALVTAREKLNEATAATWKAVGCVAGCAKRDPAAYLAAIDEVLKPTIAATGVLAGHRGFWSHAGLEIAYYDFRRWDPGSDVPMPTLGPRPTFRFNDRICVVVANVVPASHPRPFTVTVSAQAGSAVNTSPVRPSFDTAFDGGRLPGEADVFKDVVIPLEAEFAPNDIPVVTVSTLVADQEHPGKLKTAKVLSSEKLPQLRAAYRFNFTTGVLWSGLRDNTFQKVKIRADDPATKVSEAAYRIDAFSNGAGFRPMAAFSVYPVPVDIRGNLGASRLPAPTIGFALNGPVDNFYAGFSSEVLRNLHVFVGCHFGKTSVLVSRNDIDEETDSSAPATQRVWAKPQLAVGVSFNLRVIEKVFK